MRTYKTLGGALAAILSLILTQLIAQGAADLLAMIKLPAGVCNIIAGILYAGLAYAALRLLSEKVLHEHTAALGMPKLHIQPRWPCAWSIRCTRRCTSPSWAWAA